MAANDRDYVTHEPRALVQRGCESENARPLCRNGSVFDFYESFSSTHQKVAGSSPVSGFSRFLSSDGLYPHALRFAGGDGGSEVESDANRVHDKL